MKVVLLIVIDFLIALPIYTQWQKVTETNGGLAPNALIAKGDTIYAVTMDGVFVSTNNGGYWNDWGLRYNDVCSNSSCLSSIAIIGNNIFVTGEIDVGLYKTTNEGKEWIKLETVFDSYTINELYTINDKLFVATDFAVFCSSDMGGTWKNVMPYDILCRNLFIHNSILYINQENTLYYSDDYGEKWNSITSDSLRYTRIYCMITVEKGTIIGTNRGILISTDKGKTWESFIERIPNITRPLDMDVVQLYRDGEYIFAFTKSYLYRTKDMGKTWEQLPVGFLNNNCTAFTVSNTKLIVGAGASIYTSTDKGTTWKSENNGIEYTTLKSLQSIGEHLVIGTNSGLYVSTDNGNTWKLNDTPLSNHPFMSLVQHEGILYGGTEQYSLLVSTDTGTTWVKPHTDNEYCYPSGLVFAGNNLVSVGSLEINVSTDKGKTFTLVKRQTHDSYTQGLVVIDSVLISGGGGGNFYISTDYGMTWNYRGITVAPVPWNAYRIISLHATNKKFYVGTSEKGIFCSTDMGKNWFNCSKGLVDSSIVGIVYEKGRLFSCSRNGYIHVSSDEGNNWKLISRDTNLQGAVNLFAANGFLYAGTWWHDTWRPGIWKMKIEDIDISEISENAVKNIEIQVFPNPGSNIITLFINHETHNPISYLIHNGIGEEVLSGEYSERSYPFTLSINTLPEGIYFFSSTINGRRVQEKFVVMR